MLLHQVITELRLRFRAATQKPTMWENYKWISATVLYPKHYVILGRTWDTLKFRGGLLGSCVCQEQRQWHLKFGKYVPLKAFCSSFCIKLAIKFTREYLTVKVCSR